MKLKDIFPHGNNLLLKKVEAPSESEFISTDGDLSTPVYSVEYSTDQKLKGHVLLKPEHYQTVMVNAQVFTVATADDVLAEVGLENE